MRFGIGIIVCAAALPVPTPSTARAMDESALAEELVANARALRQYSWKMTSELEEKGVTELTKVENVSYDLDGSLARTASDGMVTPQQTQQGAQQTGGKKSGVGRTAARQKKDIGRTKPGGASSQQKLQAKKKKDAAKDQEKQEQLLRGLSDAALMYALPAPDLLQSFVDRAAMSEGTGDQAGSLELSGKGLIDKDDRVVYYVASESRQLRRLEAETTYDGKPLSVYADYSQAQGVIYPAHVLAVCPKKEARVRSELANLQGSGSKATDAKSKQDMQSEVKRRLGRP